MTKRVIAMGMALAGIVMAGEMAHAQALNVSASGSKSVTISDKVGQNQFSWLSKAPLENIRGTASGVSGSFTMNPKDVSSIRGTISAKVSTMKTGNTTRDKHLKSSDWLDAAKYPTIKFTISSIRSASVTGNKVKATAVGSFTMHGVTKTISVPFELTYIDASAATKKRASGDLVMIEADFTISLDDFNVSGKDGMVGSKVGETISINAKLFGHTG